jgi:hypothetical protein
MGAHPAFCLAIEPTPLSTAIHLCLEEAGDLSVLGCAYFLSCYPVARFACIMFGARLSVPHGSVPLDNFADDRHEGLAKGLKSRRQNFPRLSFQF